MKNFLSISDLAKELSISYQTARRIVEGGKISHVLIGKRAMIKREWLDDYLNNNTYRAF